MQKTTTYKPTPKRIRKPRSQTTYRFKTVLLMTSGQRETKIYTGRSQAEIINRMRIRNEVDRVLSCELTGEEAA